MTSRRKREGYYAGKTHGVHWRSHYFRTPGQYNAAIRPYMATVKRGRDD